MNELIKRYQAHKYKVYSWDAPRYKETGNQPNYKGQKAKKMISQALNDMALEIRSSQRADSALITDERGRVSHRSYQKSTFPEYMRKSGISSRKSFLDIMQKKKGKRFERLKQVAIERLEHGYENEHGRDMPNMEFKKATGQVFDNKDIIFRRVKGRIIPIKVKKKDRYDLVPF